MEAEQEPKTKSKKKSKKRSRKVEPLPGSWPSSSVKPRRVEDLVPYAANARTHTKSQVAKIAAAIEEWGWTTPVLVAENDTIIAGHGRILAAESLGIKFVPVMVATGWSEAQIKAYTIADNQLAIDSGWNEELLRAELSTLEELDFNLDLIGFSEKEQERLLFVASEDELEGADNAELPELSSVVLSQPGDLWILGGHRILCGDSTRVDDVKRLMAGESAQCVLADPPYGMGKEKDGIANDNLYREKLDAFQMAWWKAWRGHSDANASLYIWGNAPDLWRLWYVGGLKRDGDLMLRNELVWNKKTVNGMSSPLAHSYPPATERCLFFMRGQQFIGDQNKEDYWEGWEPLRLWLVEERDRMKWGAGKINEITGTTTSVHWFGKSQFRPISEGHYEKLREAAEGVAFSEEYSELFGRFFPGICDEGNAHPRQIVEKIRESRTFFDNTHDNMIDVWEFPRVHGEERFSHATPKPVAMLGRSLKTSVDKGGLVADPFLGTGTTLIAAELLGRRCFGMELEPAYVDVVVRRWQEQAGEAARLDGDGRTFDEIEGEGR